ncbi:toll-like receptor 13 [Apteryx rowi]|uniref:toll-like receptor 13 n=1 Tax=Apteryx rowi TaxID=308060 RepID=UPI000E1DD838|nr:toll-like receptor 13 [Apteryx rowi]
MRPLLALWVSVLLGMPGGSAYGFRNCIQTARDAGSFRCIQRFVRDIGSAVGDLPPGATAVNVSHNAIRRLPPGALTHLPQLRRLDLAFNQLQEVEQGAFTGLGALATLDLSHNRLAGLAAGAFQGLANLSCLLLHHNLLSTLGSGIFQPLANLRSLVLHNNHLQSFGEVASSVQNLRQLRELDACKNNLTSLGPGPLLPSSLLVLRLCNNSLVGVSGASPDLLRGVRVLDLSYNNISDVESFARVRFQNLSWLQLLGNPLDVFRLLNVSDVRPRSMDYSGLALGNESVSELCWYLQGARLRQLRLHRNGIQALRQGTFAPCPRFSTLDLSWNELRSVGCVAELLSWGQRQGLRSLVVEHNLLKRLPSCEAGARLPSLYNISFRFNRILTVSRSAFAYAPGLRVLHLNINNIADLHKGALQGLRNLTELRLDNNLLTDLYQSSFADLGRLQTLNLRNNHVSVLFSDVFSNLSQLQTLDLGGNNIRHLTGKSFQGLCSLRKLYLDGNHIQEISSDIFRPVQATLEVLDLRGNKLQYITKQQSQQPPFMYLHRLYDLKLQAQQPYGLKIIPYKFFQGLTALRALFLSQNKLLSIPSDVFDDLAQLQYLTLADSSNGMQDLPPGIFKNLSRLETLDLENVGLHSLTLEVFGNLSRLETLKLAKNELQTVNQSVAQRLSALRYLDLRKCPLSCTCENTWFQTWLNNSRVQLVYLYNYTCGSRQQPAYVYSFDMHVCFLDVGLYLFSGTAPALLLLMVLPLLYHRAYWRLKYHFYILRCWVNERWRRQEEERYQYDSFISYNSADESWVLQELVPNLERGSGRGSFRLCLHHRDFRPGRSIIDNIVDSIYNSRKTICVISRSYLQSEWCSLEIQLASYRLFDELKDVLVLVFLEAIPNAELSAYHRMRKVMLKKTYLSWPPQPEAQKLFWTKLKRALKSNYTEEEEEDFGEEDKVL